MSEISYYRGAELPDLRLWLFDDDGSLVDFAAGWTFEFKVGFPGSAAVLTKTTGITGATGAGQEPSGTPNVSVAWASGQLDLPARAYQWQLTCTSAGLQRVFGGVLKIIDRIT